MNAVLNSILDFLLPRLCFNCSEKLAADERLICGSCNPLIPRASEERLEAEFKRKFESQKIISGFLSLFVFSEEGAVQKIIHEMKYRNAFITAEMLGRITGEELKEKIIAWHPDLIIPVPIHRRRRAERGYNQSLYLARGIASVLNIPVKSRLLKRGRYTETQTALSLVERKENVKEAFIVKGAGKISGKRIVLVDDVITTGATISECGKVLLEKGAAEIFALSAAIAE